MQTFKKLLTFISFMFMMVQISSAQGNALNFNGSNNYVEGTSAVLPTGNAARTIEAWIKPGVVQNGSIFNWGGSGGVNTRSGLLYIGGYLFFVGQNNDLQGTISLPVGKWSHVAATFDGTTLKLYVNGVADGSATKTFNTTGTTFRLGVSSSSFNEYFNGNIDEVRIWNTALSLPQLQANMFNTVSPSSSGLVAYYNFNNGTAGGTNTGLTTLTDQTSNANNGTLTNFALTGATSNWVESYAMAVPTATAASALGSTSFTANWTAPATGVVDNGYRLDVSTSSTFASAIAGSPFTVAGTSQAITGLTANTTYYYRVRADKTSVTGQGGYSSTITTTTTSTNNADLSSLTTTAGTLTPTFAAATTAYTASVSNATTSVTVTPTLADANASVQVQLNNGNYAAATNGSATGALALNVGTNTINVKVTAQDGTTIKTYTITVTRACPTITVTQPSNQTVFRNAATAAINFAGTGANNYTWANNNTAIGLAASGTGNIGSFTATNTTALPITSTVTVTPSDIPYAYIAQSNNVVSVINTSTNAVVTTIPVGASPVGTAVSPDGSKVYVSHYTSSNNLSIITTATNTVATITCGTTNANAVAVSPDGSKVYVVNSSATSSVSVVNTATNTVVATIPIGSTAAGICVSPDGSKVYVANGGSGNVSVITTATNTVTATITVGTNPLGVAISSDGNTLYVSNHNVANLSVINTATNTVTATIAMGTQPLGIALSTDGSRAYIVNYGSANMTVINTTNNTVVTTVSTGANPYGVSVSPDGNYVYVPLSGSGSVKVFSTSSNTLTNTITISAGSGAIGKFISGSGCTGTPANFTITVNPTPGNALNFDGTSDYVQVPNNAAFETSIGTIETWIRPTWASASGNPCFISMRPNTLSNTRYSFHIGAAMSTIGLYNGSSYNTIPYTFVSGTWYHVALVYSGSNCIVYINGTSAGTIPTGINTAAVGNNLRIGFPDDNFASEAWKGDMDDVRLWNTQRTQPQVQTNMSTELVGNESGLVAYYKLNEAIAGGTNTGWTIAFNAVANTNNGTLNTFALSGATSNWVTGTVPSLAATNDANLINLTTTAGTISPVFASATIAYTASVSNATTSVTVTPTKSDPNANIQVRVNGGTYTTINSGSASSALALNVGSNTIDVLVTAQDGTTTKTYTITVTRTAAPPANALNFDGSNDYVSVLSAASINFTGASDYTLEAWVRFTASQNNYAGIITKATTTPGAGVGYQLVIVNNKLAAEIIDGSTNIGVGSGLQGTTVLNDGKWHHVAMVVSRSATNAKLYVDGLQEASVTNAALGNSNSSAANLYIGTERTLALYFNGNIDEVRIWNTAKTQAQLQASMLNPISGASANLGAYYNFDNGIAGGTNTGLTTLTDQTVNANNGTLTNMALTGATSNWVESYAMVVPVANAASNVNGTNFTANWTAPTTGVVDNGYRLDVSTSPTFASAIAGSPFTVAGTSQNITGLTTNTTYYYRVRADKTSVTGQGGNSYTITTTTLGVVALRLIDFNAYAHDKNVNTEWSVSDPLNCRSYIVLRSEDGRNFKEVGTINGTASSMYNFTDKQPLSGISYYRLKAISMNNAELLSNIVKVNLSNNDQKLLIYPNPVSDGHFTLGLTNTVSGEYKISILTNTGAEVYNKAISNTSSALKFDITLNRYFAKGVYLIKITSPDKSVRSQTLVIK